MGAAMVNQVPLIANFRRHWTPWSHTKKKTLGILKSKNPAVEFSGPLSSKVKTTSLFLKRKKETVKPVSS
ncbi:hypothetical protein V1264_005186 [Littorina saxatilis]|uniref:Uncharacterized protein n=1 Tax=Littorina saxatilis TaxID=31220 RepID=A0AAN9G574_9CAEN